MTAILTIAVAAWGLNRERQLRPFDVTLLYVGADDCAPCRAWRNGDGAAFLASGEFARVTYREVKSAHLEDVLRDDNWPDDLLVYRSRIKRSDGVPLWLVIADREIVKQEFGASAWRESILPRIKGLLAQGLL
jgi:hypothetical protein